MATTWMKALHRSGGIAAALGRSVDYIGNHDKTDGGELVDGYECDPYTAQAEFLLSKKLYAQRTGRDQGKHDVIAYHVRMSFSPGEVTAQQALELGRELALRWTKGRHQFIVAAHTNTNSPHVHIIFNSVNLNCTHKFVDFKRSAIALRRVSDRVCLEHGLSVIEKPGLSKGYNRAEHLGERRAPAVRDQLRDLMDAALSSCEDYDGFLAALQVVGVEVKRGKQLAFKMPGGKKFVRQDTLGEGYSTGAILERISGKRVVVPKQKSVVPVSVPTKPSLLIDIQEKMRQGKGEGYRHCATRFNLKEMSKTLIFLQERGLDDYDLLAAATGTATKKYHDLSDTARANSKRMEEISELQKHIGAYRKTKDVYAQYVRGGKKKKFYEVHRADITLCEAAKNYFDICGYGKGIKIPSMVMLKKEYAILAAENKKLYPEQKRARAEMIELLTAKHNADHILGITVEAPHHDARHEQNAHEL